MELLRICYGFTMDLLVAMDLQCMYYGFAMVLLRVYYWFTKNLLLIYKGVAMGLLWIH